jgi:hypothetical protein
MTTDDEKQESLAEIDSEVSRLTTYWANRDKNMLMDRAIINLEKPEEKQDESTWTSNEPKVFFDLSRSLLSINPPRFKLPITINYDPEEKDRMNKAERLCIGVYRSMNDRHCEMGGVDWLWDLSYWILLGWYSVFAIVRKNQEGQVEFIGDIYDPMTVYPWWDSSGLAICPRIYEVDSKDAKAMVENYSKLGLDFEYKSPPNTNGRVKVVNYWKREYKKNKALVFNAITIGGNLIKPMTLQSKLARIPIHVGAVGSPDLTTPNWMQRKGESIIAANRDMYRYKNAILQLMAEILAQNAEPNRIWKLINTQQKVGKLKGHGEDVILKPQEAVELLKSSTTPTEVNFLLQDLNMGTQKGGVPDITYGTGIGNNNQSGFAISQLLAAVKYKLGMQLNTEQRVMGRIFADFLSQYKLGGFKKITLNTTNPYDLKRGNFYMEEFTGADIPDHTYVDVVIPISSQYDKTQTIMNAVQALNAGVMSRETIWEEMLDIQDSEQEKERIMEDKVSLDPFILDMTITEEMWKREEYYRTVKHDIPKADALKRYIMIKEQNLGIRKGIPTAPNEPAAPGVSPNQMPPEARPTSAVPADLVSSFKGQAPTSPTRTMNPESAGRKGVLVSPSGQPLS